MTERKLATVLFADLAGSTALAAEQDPERTRARLERFYGRDEARNRNRLEEGVALRIGINTGEVVVGDAWAGSSFVSSQAASPRAGCSAR
jgi:class 3 adenylate cyclase